MAKAIKTLTVGDLRRLLDRLPDDQGLLICDQNGFPCPVTDIDPLTVTDEASGEELLALEFTIDEERGFGLSGSNCDRIDSRDHEGGGEEGGD